MYLRCSFKCINLYFESLVSLFGEKPVPFYLGVPTGFRHGYETLMFKGLNKNSAPKDWLLSTTTGIDINRIVGVQ